MVAFLHEIDMSISKEQWSFYTNEPGEIPQQVNQFDCGNQMLHGNSAAHSCIPQVDDQRATPEEAFPHPTNVHSAR